VHYADRAIGGASVRLSRRAGWPTQNAFETDSGRRRCRSADHFCDHVHCFVRFRGADQIELRYFGRAHTNGDTFVVFPSLRVMHVADVFPNQGPPGMDSNNGGSGVEYAATVKKAADFADRNNIDVIVNGHRDTTSTRAELREYVQFVTDYVTHAQAAKKAGKSVEDAVSSWKSPEKYKGYSTMPNAVRDTANFMLIYQETK